MVTRTVVFRKETFLFFRDLGRNNRKEWMDENRERYRTCVVQPFRRLLDELAPMVLKSTRISMCAAARARIFHASTGI
jgi:uncharacterized protein (DUF2461 family)